MRIEKIEIKNLRCIKDAAANLDSYTCFVGPNGAGKSTVLCALNIFFRNIENAPTNLGFLAGEDFYLQNVSEPIKITVTFCDLSAEAAQDLSDYVRQGKLIVSAVAEFDSKTGRAEVKQFGQRLGMDAFKEFFSRYGDGAPAGELKTIFEKIEESDPELKAEKIKKTKSEMYEGLKAFEAGRPDKCNPIPSPDQFYGVSGGKDRLSKYVQWIYIPAVKDASEEQSGTRSSALGKLLARTVSAQTNFQSDLDNIAEDARTKYQKMLDINQKALDGISTSLAKKLAQWAHPDATLKVEWEQDSQKAVNIASPVAGIVAGESGFEGKLARLGHGLQRSFLLALLQELAAVDDKNSPTLILGCEEPELYQHPPQARHLAGVFERLAEDGAQIIVTTHSPYFISGENFESVRMVRRSEVDKYATIRQFTFAELSARYAQVRDEPIKNPSATSAKLHQALQPGLSEMFFTQCLVLVEGLEDVAYIQAWMALSGRWEAFRKSGAFIVPANGKSELVRPTIIALGLKIPTLAIIDADGDKLMRPDKITGVKVVDPSVLGYHERDNRAMIRLIGGDETNLFPTGVLWDGNLVMWPSDFADTVQREFILALGSQGIQKFKECEDKARQDAGFAGGLEKNSVYIGDLLRYLWEAKAVSPSLEKICERILVFAAPKINTVPAATVIS